MRVPDTGDWHTRGNLILDREDRLIRIQGINWYGFDTVRQIPSGLNQQDYRTLLELRTESRTPRHFCYGATTSHSRLYFARTPSSISSNRS